MARVSLSVAVGLLVLIVATALPAEAVLYGLSSSDPGSLYAVDPTSGAATFITDLSGTEATSLVGLAARNGLLYATDVIDTAGGFNFGSIDPTTGMFTPINTQGGSINWWALAYRPGSDLFYTVDADQEGFPLLSVTPGGAITSIGDTDIQVGGLAFDSNHDVLYAVDGSVLYTLDPTTGAATAIGDLGVSAGILAGLEYDNDSDILYLNVGLSDHSLYSVDTATGAATLIGTNGSVAGIGIDGLAIITDAAVPEPASLLLLGSGLAALAAWRRGRRR